MLPIKISSYHHRFSDQILPIIPSSANFRDCMFFLRREHRTYFPRDDERDPSSPVHLPAKMLRQETTSALLQNLSGLFSRHGWRCSEPTEEVPAAIQYLWLSDFVRPDSAGYVKIFWDFYGIGTWIFFAE